MDFMMPHSFTNNNQDFRNPVVVKPYPRRPCPVPPNIERFLPPTPPNHNPRVVSPPKHQGRGYVWGTPREGCSPPELTYKDAGEKKKH